jgi:hypothetical protein
MNAEVLLQFVEVVCLIIIISLLYNNKTPRPPAVQTNESSLYPL